MMKYLVVLALAPVLAFAASRGPGAEGTGEPARDFTLIDAKGASHTLSQYKGSIIVLEWTNPGCPFVRRHYDSGDMQALQKKYTGRGVIWLTINSTNPAHRDFLTNDSLAARYARWNAAYTAIFRDPDGSVGKLYGAKTTPDMFVIDPSFRIAYRGAIDDDPRGGKEERTNYVDAAITALLAGTSPEPAVTQPYGCSVKYAE